jgi:hypothetical protein
MFTPRNLRFYIITVLIFCVVSSKNILIYNEETLVALSFLGFVFFVFQYFGQSIQQSLDLRSQSIQSELQNFLNLKQESLQVLKGEHQKFSLLKKSFLFLNKLTCHELSAASSIGDLAVYSELTQQISQKLYALHTSHKSKGQEAQQLIAEGIHGLILLKFQQQKKIKNK